jgi:Zn-dependent protease
VNHDLTLGHVAGIRVSATWSVPVIAAVYAAWLALGQFPLDVPDRSAVAYWATGALAAVLFFVSLLGHEIAHAAVARRERIGVSGITLWLLGGVTKLDSEASDPGSEFRISVVGPLSSLVIAAVFWVAHELTRGTAAPSLLSVMFGWLAIVNLALAVFNLIPAAPLDGGRVLSSILWWHSGDAASASAWSARVGVAVGALLAVAGLWQMASGGGAEGIGLWGLLIGWWIAVTARNELRSAPLRERLRSVRAGDAMLADPPVAPSWITVDAFLAQLPAHTPHRAFPVCRADGNLTGLLTAVQVAQTDAATRRQLHVGELAFPLDRITVAGVADPLLSVLQRLDGQASTDVLVLWPDGRVAGILGNEQVRRVAGV